MPRKLAKEYSVHSKAVANGFASYRLLLEFTNDVAAAGVGTVGDDWPDLLVTYHKALVLLTEIDGAEETSRRLTEASGESKEAVPVPCIECLRTDLPLHIDGRCPGCSGVPAREKK